MGAEEVIGRRKGRRWGKRRGRRWKVKERWVGKAD
jgi:hypothetical protein